MDRAEEGYRRPLNRRRGRGRCSPVIRMPAALAPVAGAACVGPAVQWVAAEDLQVTAIEHQVRMGVAWFDMIHVQPDALMLAPPARLASSIIGAQGLIARAPLGCPAARSGRNRTDTHGVFRGLSDVRSIQVIHAAMEFCGGSMGSCGYAVRSAY